MQGLIDEITHYLDYLNNTLHLSTSVHFEPLQISRFSEKVLRALLPYNTHKNPYCIMVKGQGQEKLCIRNQRLVLKKCRKEKNFCGECHAGVYEYIHAICGKDGTVGCVSVSGYRKAAPARKKINIELWEKNLVQEEIPLTLCETVIPPLCRMLEMLTAQPKENPSGEYNLILQYINEHHASVSLDELCRHFCRSRSYISHMFKSTSGMTIRAYCNKLKLEMAKNLLTKTDLPITEVAFDAGFNDVSYFIALFRRKFGMSPLRYRKKEV